MTHRYVRVDHYVIYDSETQAHGGIKVCHEHSKHIGPGPELQPVWTSDGSSV